MQKFMASVVNQTTVGADLTRVGVILYSNDPTSVFTLKQYSNKRDVLQTIAALKSPLGDTYTGKALTYSLQFFEQEHGGRAALQVPQILMVITDGDATDQNQLVQPSLALRDRGISVFSIGVEGANRTQLEIMAAGDTSKVFYVDNFEALEKLYKNITQVLCETTKPGKTPGGFGEGVPGGPAANRGLGFLSRLSAGTVLCGAALWCGDLVPAWLLMEDTSCSCSGSL